jgi:hypothetical protein
LPKPQVSVAKRHKERAKQEKRRLKAEKRAQRKQDRSNPAGGVDGEDPDLAGIVPGPQPAPPPETPGESDDGAAGKHRDEDGDDVSEGQ